MDKRLDYLEGKRFELAEEVSEAILNRKNVKDLIIAIEMIDDEIFSIIDMQIDIKREI